jgi:hypothetical protein
MHSKKIKEESTFMDIFLTDFKTSEHIRFPMLPEDIRVQSRGIFESYNIMAKGSVMLPYGEELTGFSWSGIFPGEARKHDPYINEWQSPNELLRLLEIFRTKEKKLRLLVTETSINRDVYIQSLTGQYKGGYGDYHYTLNLIHAKDLFIKMRGKSDTPKADERPEPPPVTTYTVISGDTLWRIAQRFLGEGRRYPEIHAANRDVIGNNPNRIFPGQVFTIPN